MTQKNKVKSTLAPDLRKQWKKEAEDEIILLQEDIDMLELPEDKAKQIDDLISKFKERLNDTISLFEVTTEIAIKEDYLFENILDEIYWQRATASESEINRMIEIVEQDNKGQFVKCESLAEKIKLESFINELTVNPYQLKLIA